MKDNIIDIVRDALNEFYSKEKYILNNNVSERCLVYNYAKYLNEKVKNSTYNKFNIDLEYNRRTDELKSLGLKKIAYPDLILHERGIKENNILVIEFKKCENCSKQKLKNDEEKLKAFKEEYNYKTALQIVFGRDKETLFKEI